jgi:hypothetical protein
MVHVLVLVKFPARWPLRQRPSGKTGAKANAAHPHLRKRHEAAVEKRTASRASQDLNPVGLAHCDVCNMGR